MAAPVDTVASELKGLKAAYRTAIGSSKRGGKKNKNKKKGKAEPNNERQDDNGEEDAPTSKTYSQNEGNEARDDSNNEDTRINENYKGQDRNGNDDSSMNNLDSHIESGEGQDATTVGRVPEATRQLLQSREEVTMEEPVVKPQAPTRRTTRRQAAVAQAGQYISDLPNNNQDRSLVTERQRGIDYITSLFSGRPSGASPSFGKHLGRAMADQHVAEKAVSKSMVALNKGLEVTLIESAEILKNEVLKVAAIEAPRSPVRFSTRSPAKSPVKTLQEVKQSYGIEESADFSADGDDVSFVKKITCRSPAKPVSRIEDSVEALDQLEEALEAIDQAALAERIMMSPEKIHQKASTSRTDVKTSLDCKVPVDLKRAARTKTNRDSTAVPLKLGHTSMRVKPTAPKLSVLKKAKSMTFKSSTNTEAKMQIQPATKAPVSKRPVSTIVKSATDTGEKTKAPNKRPNSLLPPKETVRSSKPVTRPAFSELPGEGVARKLKEQREARLAQRQSSEDNVHTARVISVPPKIKSTKPLTKAVFELPGEAVSRRKREAHEARLKVQEEEERKRREFKAKPLRKSVVPIVSPRDTVSSRARQGKIGLENTVPNRDTLSKRGSNVGAHRPSILNLNTANTSAPRAPGPALIRQASINTTASGLSMSGRALQRTVSATEVQLQRQRAKEIYNRDSKLSEEIEYERREREASAKRAREQAAERGRQASRDWAEKQMARKLAEGDKGMSAGYGPGGQIGLKG